MKLQNKVPELWNSAGGGLGPTLRLLGALHLLLQWDGEKVCEEISLERAPAVL